MTLIKRSSSNTLHPITEVAADLGVARQTLYNWLSAKPPVITHTWDVKGVPVFTYDEVEKARKVAEERRQAMNVIRLNK